MHTALYVWNIIDECLWSGLIFNFQYLLRNGITEISRDNFSYSTKIKVGDFYEARDGPEVSVSTCFIDSMFLKDRFTVNLAC